MAELFKAGWTSRSIDIFIQDTSKTDGSGLPGLTYATSGLKFYYRKGATGSMTAITLATLANAQAAWSSGGFVEIDATNAKGWYRLDLPDAAISSLGFVSLMGYGATNMAQSTTRIQCVAYDPEDATRLGLAALPNANAGANGGLPLGDASGRVDVGKWLGTAAATPSTAGVPAVDVVRVNNTAQTAGDLAALSTTISNKLGAWTGSGLNTVLGALRALANKASSLTPTDLSTGGTFDNTTDSLEAQSDGAAFTTTVKNAIADAILTRDLSALGASASRCLLRALRFLLNKRTVVGTTLTVYREDDSTSDWTATVGTDASADPITSVDPT